jgi:hypothetical protein
MINRSTDSIEVYVDGKIQGKSYLTTDFEGNITVSLKGIHKKNISSPNLYDHGDIL